MSKICVFWKTCERTNRVLEQVYYLSLTHTEGSATYSTTAKVINDIPEYLETGGAFVSVLPEDFSFQPAAETVAELYKVIENAVIGNIPVEITFDTVYHIPEYVLIQDTGNKKEYSITIFDL